jgi:molybdenum cofactor cytidylyltransferase
MSSVNAITPIILAAGDSIRMGYPKALLPLGSDIFLTRILRILKKAKLPRPVIILGRAASEIQPRIQDWPSDILINPDPSRGQLSSIQLGLSRLGIESIAGMIWPVDQPAVSEELVERLVQLFLTSQARIAFPMYRGKRGHPAIFHRDLFQEFLDAPLAEGPKKILLHYQRQSVALPTEESASVQDIDTPDDYLALTGETLDSVLARVNASKAL